MLKAMAVEEKLLTADEAADRLRVADRTFLYFVRRGLIDAIRLPNGEVRVESSALEKFVERCRA